MLPANDGVGVRGNSRRGRGTVTKTLKVMARQVEKACMHGRVRCPQRVMLPVAHHTHHTTPHHSTTQPHAYYSLSKTSCVPRGRELGAGS